VSATIGESHFIFKFHNIRYLIDFLQLKTYLFLNIITFTFTYFQFINVILSPNSFKKSFDMKQFVIFVCLSICIISCNPTKTTTSKCTTEGIVKDRSGLDGCKFLIELTDGKKLNPIEFSDKSFQLKDGQKIRFSYESVDAMNICMAGETVKVTCISEI
jgi:hypothetical protein